MRKYYIYEIKNKQDGKTYIGKRLCPEDLTPETDKYMGSGELIVNAIKEYGIDNFEKHILRSDILDSKEGDEAEKYFIGKYKELGKAEYNIALGGTGGYLGEEVCRRLKKNWENNKEERLKILQSEEIKTKIHDGLVKAHAEGKFDNMFTEEVRKKQSESTKAAWIKYGDKFRELRKTEEYRKAVSEAKKGVPVPEERKKRISETVKKLHEDPEYRKHFEENCKKNGERQRGAKAYTINGKHVFLHEENIPENAIRGWV